MIIKDNNFRVMQLFFKFPYKNFHIRELARITGLSSTGIIKIVKRLKKEKLLLSKKEKVVKEIKPDFEGRFAFLKRVYNLYSLYDSGLIDYLKKEYESPQAIIVFGSYANGSDSERSDIDIAITMKKKQAIEVSTFEKKLSRKISIHNIDMKIIEPEFKNSLANGIVLEGFMDLS